MGDLSPHFSRHEFACKCGCGFNTVDTELLVLCEAVRQHYGAPVTVTSGARCADHNAAIGGRPGSLHLVAKAADIVVKGVTPENVYAYCTRTWPDRYGIFRYDQHVHLDCRDGKAR